MSIEWKETCVRCGSYLPEGARISQDYCSRECYMKEYGELEKQGRLDAKRNRPPCAYCGGPVSPARLGHAIYCSRECCIQGCRVPKTCPHCKKKFRGDADQVHCSWFCYCQAERRIHPARPCMWCGKTIIKPHRTTRYCSLSCGGKAGMDKRLVATGRLPRLNGYRFDQLVC